MHGILLQIDRFDYQATSPMFPNELNALLESESKPKPMFYRAAYSDYFAKVRSATIFRDAGSIEGRRGDIFSVKSTLLKTISC